MKKPGDTYTVELPGLQVVQAPIESLPVPKRYEALRWKGPKERTHCGNCEHLGGKSPHLRCTLGHVDTVKGAICDRWTKKAQAPKDDTQQP